MDSFNNNLINCPAILKGMSHEMRTQMNAIVAFSFLMKENCRNSTEGEEFSNQILSSCDQLIQLFDSYLDTAIVETGNSIVESKNCNLDHILDELISEFRDELKNIADNKVELISEIRIHNASEVNIDKSKIYRIIRSLFKISLFNTNTGYIKIGYYSENDELTFYVLDSGQGYFKCKEFIQDTDLNELVHRHNDTYTAINMTLAKNLIKLLGGTIRIECNGLTGSGVYFTVPARVVSNVTFNINNYVKKMIAI